jgi:prophage regulatory protein
MNSTERILRRPEVEHRTGLSRSGIYELLANGEFPKPIKLGSRSVGWLETEIAAWIQQRVQTSRG